MRIYGTAQIPYDVIPSLFESDIRKNIQLLDANNTSFALLGYLNPNLNHHYPIKNELIDHLVKNIEDLDVSFAVVLLESLAEK